MQLKSRTTARAAQSFDERVDSRFDRMPAAEQRVARYFQANREDVLIASAAKLAVKAQTSDATIVRASRSLGFSGLDDLRRTLAEELRNAISPAERLTRLLDQVGDSPPAAFATTLEIHLQSLNALTHTISLDAFERAVRMICRKRRTVIFGLGPSSAIAAYMVVQLRRFGLDATSLTHTGLLFADDLRRLRRGDLLIILAYGRVYAELSALLDEASEHKLASILLTDTLAAKLRQRVDLLLPVPRGRAEMLSMHTATLGLIEALLVGIASQRPKQTLASLEKLNALREKLARKVGSLR